MRSVLPRCWKQTALMRCAGTEAQPLRQSLFIKIQKVILVTNFDKLTYLKILWLRPT